MSDSIGHSSFILWLVLIWHTDEPPSKEIKEKDASQGI